MRIDWDLSGRHTRAEVSWPKERLDAPTTSLEPIESVRIRLPAGKLLQDDRVRSIILHRKARGPDPLPGAEGEIVDYVQVDSDPLSYEDAHRLAVAYAEQFDLPRAPLDGWLKRREQGVDPVTDNTATTVQNQRLGGKDGPAPYLELGYSTNDERPGAVSMQFFWPSYK